MFAAALAAPAQNPGDLFTQAPPVVDQALRERVRAFFQAHTDGKFRLADQYVAEDSKDAFFEADKRRCRSFEIIRISYEENFEKAAVVVNCETEMMMPPKGLVTLKMPVVSRWKVVNRDWSWYTEPRKVVDTPFGKMSAGSSSAGVAPAIPRGPSPEDLGKMVTLDRNTLLFLPDSAGSAEVVINNAMAGQVHVTVASMKGTDLKVEPDRMSINGNGEAKLNIRFNPDSSNPRGGGSSQEIRLMVQPINREFLITVKFLK